MSLRVHICQPRHGVRGGAFRLQPIVSHQQFVTLVRVTGLWTVGVHLLTLEEEFDPVLETKQGRVS